MSQRPPLPNHLRVHLSGEYRIELKGRSLQLPTQKTKSLLAYLILNPGIHTREKLATLIWGDSSDPSARGSLRKVLTILRKHIDVDLIFADREIVQLNPSYPMWVDVYAFEEQADALLSGSAVQAGQFKTLSYEGSLLVDFYDEWILPFRAHYESLYVNVLLRGVEKARGQSEYQLAIEYAQKILKSDPANERAHQHLMFCYITLGERNNALEQYDTCQRALEDELAVEPTQETQSLYRWIKQYETDMPSLAARITNLPIPISSFVGRGRELSKIKGIISSARLVTLTGPGGSGKTRLAIHAATDLIDSFEDGIWWVELSSVSESKLVPFTVAKALGLESRSEQPMIEGLKKYLCDRKTLIILDNCEHLIEACAHLAETLLTCCADLKVLTTSREALCLPGENVWLVPPLTLPGSETISRLDLQMEYEAVRLFIERASAVNPEFRPNDEKAILITQVCQRLDGIPLAIELAAARVRSLDLSQISAGLDNTFQMLSATNRTANQRHQTLQAAVDWSYDLLSESERLLFCRLSVFSDDWTLDAAEVVCSGDGIKREEIPELLALLVKKSLVNPSVNNHRYNMLETLRQYGDEKLGQAGEKDQVFERYLDYYLKMAGIADEKIRGHEQLKWFRWFEAEGDNLTNAMKVAFGSQDMLERGCELICSLSWDWGGVAGYYARLKYWLEIALDLSENLGRTPTRAKVLFVAGQLSTWGLLFLNVEGAKSAIEESLTIWRELPQEFLLEQGQCLLALGWIQKCILDDDFGYENLCISLEIFKRLDNPWWHAWALNFLAGMLIKDYSDFQIIKSVLDEEISLLEKAGNLLGSANPLYDMGKLLFVQGDLHAAKGYLSESLEINKRFGAKEWVFLVLVPLGDTTRGLKDYDRADAYYKESITYLPMLMDDRQLPRIYQGLGYVALEKNNPGQAQEYFGKALRTSQEYEMEDRILLSIAAFGCLAVVREEHTLAAQLFGVFFTHLRPMRSKLNDRILTLIDRQEIEGYLSVCKAHIGENFFEESWKVGSTMSIDEGINVVIQLSK